MKSKWKKSSIIFSYLLIVVLVLALSAVPASAKSIETNTWTSGELVKIDLKKYPAPFDWLQLIDDDGVKITEPGEICHTLRGGSYGWIADIRRLNQGEWVKVPTTQGWIPNTEGRYMACAQAPIAGTYALFGYYNGPKEKTKKTLPNCDLDLSDFEAANTTHDGKLVVYLLTNNPPEEWEDGISLSYKLLSVTPSDSAALTSGNFKFYDPTYLAEFIRTGLVTSINVQIITPTCTQDITVEVSESLPD